MSTIRLKRSDVPDRIPSVEQLELGEVAINTYDGTLYFKQHQEYFDDDLQEIVTVDKVIEFTSHVAVENTLYVQKAGSDTNSGSSWSSAFASIDKAVKAAELRQTMTLIYVGPGIYFTKGHIDVADNTVISATHRSAFIKPVAGYEERNVFRLGSGCFLEGFVFEGWRLDNLENPTEGFAACFRPGANITRVPYVHKVVVRTPPYWTTVAPPLDRQNANPLVGRGAGVILADGAVLDPDSIFPNIMAWGATPVTHNGIGYCAKNGALINAVNAISVWCHKHFLAIDGGQIILSACSTQFGDYALVSQGVKQVIVPNETNVELFVDQAASTAISNASDDIKTNLISELTNQGFTTNWPDSYNDLTTRDAGLFLQSMSWVLQAANEKPMLDFSKGMYNVAGNRVFTSIPYNYNKCYRDTGLITEAIAYDILFGSNYRSINAALAYYRVNANAVLTTQLSNTLLALNKQKEIVASYLSAGSLTRSNALFDLVINIITNGTGVAPTYVYPDPTGYDNGFFQARRLLASNKIFIQDEIDGWIAAQVAGNISPFTAGFTYDQAACRADVGFIIDALLYDITYGGNLETYNAAMAYFVGTTAQLGTGEKAATLAAYARLIDIVGDILQATTVTNTASNTTVQDVSGTAGSLAAATFGQSRVQEIYDTIDTSGTPPSKIIPNLTWPEDHFTTSYNTLINEIVIISDAVLDYLSTVETGYNYDKCYRDTLLINQAIAYDILFDSNYRSINAALAYYRLSANKVLSGQVEITIEAITRQKLTVSNLLNGAALTRSNALFDLVINIITNGTGVAPTYVYPDPTGYDDGFFQARRLLESNKTFIQDDIDGWIAAQVSGNISPFTAGFTYDQAACRADVGFIIDALLYDITYGGNLETYNAAMAYFVGTTTQLGTGEKAATLAAYARLRLIINDVVLALTVSPVYTGTAQDISGTAGSSVAATFAQARINNIITTISTNGNEPVRILPDATWPDLEFRSAFGDINTNTNIIANDVLRYINVENKTLLGAFIYAWEYMKDQIKALPDVDNTADLAVTRLVDALIATILNPVKTPTPSVITAIGHTWTGIMAGVALTKIPPAFNLTSIEDSILELQNGRVIASGQDDQGSALFIGGMKIDADTGELSGPPFDTAVNRIATRAAIARSF
jgi:hypothetical protein